MDINTVLEELAALFISSEIFFIIELKEIVKYKNSSFVIDFIDIVKSLLNKIIE